MIRVLTVRQPWAWAIIHGGKDLPPVGELHFGAIIGVVDLVDVHTVCGPPFAEGAWPVCSPWAEHDRTHLVLANSRPLSAPIPFKGALHLQTAPEGVEAEIVQQIGPIGG